MYLCVWSANMDTVLYKIANYENRIEFRTLHESPSQRFPSNFKIVLDVFFFFFFSRMSSTSNTIFKRELLKRHVTEQSVSWASKSLAIARRSRLCWRTRDSFRRSKSRTRHFRSHVIQKRNSFFHFRSLYQIIVFVNILIKIAELPCPQISTSISDDFTVNTVSKSTTKQSSCISETFLRRSMIHL